MSTSTIQPRQFINGEFQAIDESQTFDLHSPSTGELIAKVPEATAKDVDAAVAAAKAAFPAWSALSPKERSVYLSRLASLLAEHSAELAQLEAKSMGRPVTSYFDAHAAADYFRYFSEAAYPMGTSSLNTPGFVNMGVKQPFGVCGIIIPWNAPLIFFSKKGAAALAAGNTVVLKSSEKAPLTCAKAAELVAKAGFPPGVFNIISGHGAAGAAMSSHMDIRIISFTGSTRTGRAIQVAAANSNLKNCIFELGGKSPALVFEDADIEQAIQATVPSIGWNSGQTCFANSRIYVHKSIAQTFIEGFKTKFMAAKLGDPTHAGTTQGPQADKVQHETVKRYLALGEKSGTKITEDLPNISGLYVSPTIFTDTPEDAQIMKEEIFGPVVHINTFESEAEAIAKANDTEYGLYAAVFTKDIDRAMRVSRQLEAGTVGVNCSSPTKGNDMPFGGWKGSGIGRESYIGGVESFMEDKAVLIKVAPL
ncbi:hypothetical protein O988_02550 [Pseudogymnoascus sp. VKM F-3808]|nr:hypothetical protein O988_02550 [Pseudogymnoascus sp. VKM F-3808]